MVLSWAWVMLPTLLSGHRLFSRCHPIRHARLTSAVCLPLRRSTEYIPDGRNPFLPGSTVMTVTVDEAKWLVWLGYASCKGASPFCLLGSLDGQQTEESVWPEYAAGLWETLTPASRT
jgi:hypothetical protein